ncbi:MAG: hypothetical protein GC179_05845 [Anaerolineaceae bacterium]|nr:hypothetical protein [Anaerolineaceae bacterium]
MYDINQYEKDNLHRAQMLREAEHIRLEKIAQPSPTLHSGLVLHIGHRGVIAFVVILLVLAYLLLVPQTSYAQDKVDADKSDAYCEQMIAFRLGHYYYVTGDYERAIGYYDTAIAGIPEAVLGHIASLRDIYWYKGDAQLMAGQMEKALASYRHYVALAGNDAQSQELAFVKALEDNLAAGIMVMEPLEL